LKGLKIKSESRSWIYWGREVDTTCKGNKTLKCTRWKKNGETNNLQISPIKKVGVLGEKCIRGIKDQVPWRGGEKKAVLGVLT